MHYADWSYEEGHDYFTRHIEAETSLCLVAEADSGLVGYLVGYTKARNSLRPIEMAVLESMFVHHDSRSGGVGEQLVRAFIGWCDGHQVVRVSVSAYVANDGAVRFYERLGFVQRLLTLECPV